MPMSNKVLLLAALVVFILVYGFVAWWTEEPMPWEPFTKGKSHAAPTETEEPVMLVDGQWVVCHPFTEMHNNPDAMKAKYTGKTVLLHGIVQDTLNCDGGHFIRCSGARGEVFYVEMSRDEIARAWPESRVIVKGELNQIWSDHRGYFDNLTVWDGDLQEIQEATEDGWKVVWKLDKQ
jgi:hypothetical protein